MIQHVYRLKSSVTIFQPRFHANFYHWIPFVKVVFSIEIYGFYTNFFSGQWGTKS